MLTEVKDGKVKRALLWIQHSSALASYLGQ